MAAKVDSLNTLVIDVGNSEFKGFLNGKSFRLLNAYERSEGSLPYRGSEWDIFSDGFAVELFNRRIGDCNGQYLFNRSVGEMKMADQKKEDYYPLVVAGYCSTDFSSPWRVTISHWDETKGPEIEKKLKGVHPCRVNGREGEVDIREVHFMPEGQGANNVYRRSGGTGVLAILDIGFNTVGFSLYSGSTRLKHLYVENTGVREIIRRMEQDQALGRLIGYPAGKDAFITALVNGGTLPSNADGSGSIDIKQFTDGYKFEWLKETLSDVHRKYGSIVNKVSDFWIVGGGANIIKTAVKGTSYYVPENPEFINADGMQD